MYVIRRVYDGFATSLFVDKTGNYSSSLDEIRFFSYDEALHYVKTRTFLLVLEKLVIEKV